MYLNSPRHVLYIKLIKTVCFKKNNAEETATNVSNGIVEKLTYNKLGIWIYEKKRC